MIIHSTTITTIRADTRLIPKSALWRIINLGNTHVLVNGSFLLAPGQIFGIDLTSLFMMGENVQVESDTEFNLVFGDTPARPTPFNIRIKRVYFIETILKKQ